MKVIVTLFWALFIGEVVGYIMTALAGVPDNPIAVGIVALVFGVFVLILSKIALLENTSEK